MTDAEYYCKHAIQLWESIRESFKSGRKEDVTLTLNNTSKSIYLLSGKCFKEVGQLESYPKATLNNLYKITLSLTNNEMKDESTFDLRLDIKFIKITKIYKSLLNVKNEYQIIKRMYNGLINIKNNLQTNPNIYNLNELGKSAADLFYISQSKNFSLRGDFLRLKNKIMNVVNNADGSSYMNKHKNELDQIYKHTFNDFNEWRFKYINTILSKL